MKKLLVVIFSFMLIPTVVFADEYCNNEEVKEWCTGSSCLSELQSSYNKWSATGNSGKSCIKVIAQRQNNNKTYFEGKNPSTDFKCSNGQTATAKLIASGLSDSETDVSECTNSVCYVPELWAMDCGSTSGSSSNSNNSNNNTVNSGTSNNSSSVNNNSNNSNNNSSNSSNSNVDSDVSTNSNGQITGTTDTKDTGVETYFIVLFIMVILSYAILILSKKKNLFKNI